MESTSLADMAPTISTTVYSASSSPFFHSGLQTGEQPEDQISQMGDFDDDGATIETASLTEVDISEIQNDLYASKFLPVTHTLQPQPGVYGENVKFVSHHGLGGSSQQYPPVGDDATADDDMDDTGKHLVHFPSTPSLRHKDTRKDMRINTISTSTQDPFDSSKWSSAELEQMDSQGHRYHYITRSQSSATYPPRPRSSYYPYSNYNPSLSNSTPHLSAQFRNYYDSRGCNIYSRGCYTEIHMFFNRLQGELVPYRGTLIQPRGFASITFIWAGLSRR